MVFRTTMCRLSKIVGRGTPGSLLYDFSPEVRTCRIRIWRRYRLLEANFFELNLNAVR